MFDKEMTYSDLSWASVPGVIRTSHMGQINKTQRTVVHFDIRKGTLKVR